MAHLLQSLLAGLSIGAIYALVALGFAIVYKATGAINFAQGEYVMAGGVIGGVVHESFSPPILVTLAVVAIAGVLLGLLTELACVRFSRDPDPNTITIATIGFAVALKGTVLILTNRKTYGLPGFTGDTPLQVAGASVHPQLLWNLLLVGLAAVGLTLFFRYTRRGTAMRAAADDQEMLSVFGVPFRTTTAWAFGLAAVLGAAGGAGLTPLTLISFEPGTLLGLKGFAAAMLGGLGSMYGALVGGFLLGLVEALAGGYGASAFADVTAFVVLLLVLFLRPSGILQQAAVERV